MNELGEEKDPWLAAADVWRELRGEIQALEGADLDGPDPEPVAIRRVGAVAARAVDLIYGASTRLPTKVEARLTAAVAEPLTARRTAVYARSSIAARVKTKRAEAGMSVTDVAAKAGLDEAAVSALENNAVDVREVGAPALARLGRALKLRLEDAREPLRRSLAAMALADDIAGPEAAAGRLSTDDEAFVAEVEAAWEELETTQGIGSEGSHEPEG